MHLVWELLEKYQPELLIQLGVLLACWLASLVYDLFGPVSADEVHVRRMIFVICWPLGFVVSMALWASITDPDNDKTLVRLIISALGSTAGSLGAPFINRWAASFIKWKWPGLGVTTALTK